MKKLLFVCAAPAALSALAALTGCGGGAIRSPDVYRDDTKAALSAKDADIRACYDDILKGNPTASGKVTVKFEVETEGGKIQNVTVDKANTTAPDPVSQCVTKNISGVAVTPPDVRKGEGVWVYEFSPPAASSPAAAPLPSKT
ncbi:AgmX/PglI C-terminal domain-containing protein [Pendulispora albinea]|uniref:AgmX/PglI C-terminal domain-containing protein n=1 Tax=Pendulispora albinea TaxID=2741071 RepID=A0ABZ2LV26_9BACT